ncbi:MAG: alpha-amylase family glycosyl hydrolase, partial [Eubacteriales bacterium]|nr:alpha-amylase family glycosyl hydrolase [Eubacteriales bacterium]
MNIYENYPKESFYSTFNILGSHDVERIGSLISKEKLKACVYFQMAFPGVPVIYYGDEAGLKGHKDPDNRKTYPWGKQDKDLLETYKEAIKMRKEHKVFVEGSFTSGFCNDNVYYFKRENEEELAIIVLNNASEESEYKIDSYQGKIKAGEVTVLYKKKVLKS